ncbi:MAG: hypothetical protein PVJ28_00380 [Acidimicrobiia bacterium]
MHRLRSRSVALLAGIALFALSGMAFAADGEDTVLNYGYDEESHFFAWNVTSLDWEPNLELLGELYGDDEEARFEALLEACGLEGDPEDPDYPFEYDYIWNVEEDTITIEKTATSDSDASEGEEAIVEVLECGEFQGGDVTGPAGQVNHGMFMKFFNEHYDGENRGCIVSQIARSPLGKDDQQVKPSDSDDEEVVVPTEEVSEPVGGTITFTTVSADCDKGPDRDGEKGEKDGERRGPPDHAKDKADKWGDDGPGKSGSAGNGRP